MIKEDLFEQVEVNLTFQGVIGVALQKVREGCSWRKNKSKGPNVGKNKVGQYVES